MNKNIRELSNVSDLVKIKPKHANSKTKFFITGN